MTLSTSTLGSLIILAFFGAGLMLCLSVCMALWLRYKGTEITVCPLLFPPETRMDQNQPSSATILPSICRSELTSEPGGYSMATLSSSSPLRSSGQTTNFKTFLEVARVPKESNLTTSPKMSPRTVRPNTLILNPGGTSGYSVQWCSPLGQTMPTFSPAEFKSFSSDTDDSISSISSSQVSTPTADIPNSPERNRFKIGHVKVRVRFSYESNSLEIDLLRNYQLPSQMNVQENDLYAKIDLLSGHRRIRRSKSMMNPNSNNPIITTFHHQISPTELPKTSMIVSLCKNASVADQGMFIASAVVEFESLGLKEMAKEDFDSGVIEIPLNDYSPHQMVNCGGSLELRVEYDPHHHALLLTNITISDINLQNINFKSTNGSDEAEGALYIKISVYEGGRAACWYRTRPSTVTSRTKYISLTDEIRLNIPSGNLETLQILLSIRLKTGKRGERKILGDQTLEGWWTEDEITHLLEKHSTLTINLKVPL